MNRLRPIMRKYLLLMLSVLWLTACSGDDDPALPEPLKEVRVLFSVNGVGDLAFNDDILRGVMRSQKENGFLLHYHIPSGAEDAERKLKEWMQDDDARHTFTILATNEYEELARKLLNGEQRNNYLLVEASSDDYTFPVFSFSGYGVSFLAGVAAWTYTQGDTAAYLGGERGHLFIEECYLGFRDGYCYAGGKEVVSGYLSGQSDGFAMPLQAYMRADSLYRRYPFIYAIAGGSNSGIYQYLREHPAVQGYTAGVDVDQSAYSDRIIGSMIKEVGRCIDDYITLWLEGETLPSCTLFDLTSGYTRFQVSESYMPVLKNIVESHWDTASKKETEYNEKKSE